MLETISTSFKLHIFKKRIGLRSLLFNISMIITTMPRRMTWNKSIKHCKVSPGSLSHLTFWWLKFISICWFATKTTKFNWHLDDLLLFDLTMEAYKRLLSIIFVFCQCFVISPYFILWMTQFFSICGAWENVKNHTCEWQLPQTCHRNRYVSYNSTIEFNSRYEFRYLLKHVQCPMPNAQCSIKHDIF